MIWKIYFWLLIVLLPIGVYNEGINNFWDILWLLMISWALVGLYFFSYKKAFLSHSFWKSFFVIYILWDLTFNLIALPIVWEKQFDFIGFAVILPLYYSLYCYAFIFMKQNSRKIEYNKSVESDS